MRHGAWSPRGAPPWSPGSSRAPPCPGLLKDFDLDDLWLVPCCLMDSYVDGLGVALLLLLCRCLEFGTVVGGLVIELPWLARRDELGSSSGLSDEACLRDQPFVDLDLPASSVCPIGRNERVGTKTA